MRSNKEIVAAFYEEAFNNWDLSHIDDYMRDDYMQHSPEVADGKEGFLAFFREFIKQKPHATIVRLLEDGDLVCVFFRCDFESGVVAKVFDLYRLEDGKLAEHWDCTMRVDNMPVSDNHGQF